MAEEKYVVHTTAKIDPGTGKQVCVRCGELLHEVDLNSIPKPGPFNTELSKIEAHCYAPNINLMVIPGRPKAMLGENGSGFKLPESAEFCGGKTGGKKAD